jgi:NADH-quinone oxidoreductase subunit M
MFSHGIMTALFFSLIGMVYGRTHTRMIPEMGGLARPLPWLAASFYIGGLASLGLPGLSGFVAESHVFLAGFFGNPWHSPAITEGLTILATMSIVVTAVYVLRGLGTVFMGPVTNAHFAELTDADWPERICTGMLIASIVFVGLMPGFLINLIERPLMPLVNRLADAAVVMGVR